jgi:anti-sigma factor RsiW
MSHPVQRRDDLLCDRLLGELTAAETVELEALLRDHPIDDADLTSLEDAAIAMTSAVASTEPMPPSIVSRLQNDAREFAEQHRAHRDTTPAGEQTLASAGPPPPPAAPATNVVRLRDRRVVIVAALGWAAAALLVIALGVERSRDPVVQVVTVSVSAPVPPPPVPPTLREQREKLIADGRHG